MKLILLLFSVFTLARSGLVYNEDSVSRLVVGTFVNCMNSDMSLCLKEQALKATERLGTVRQLKITDSLTLINNGAKEARSLEPLSSELEIRKQQVSQRLWDSTSDLLRNSDLEYSFDDDDEEDDESRSLGEVEESRGKKKKEKKKKLKLLISLAILAKVKAAALVLLFLGVMAASLYKIALILKIAFLAKVFAIIKALIAKKQHGEHWGPPADEHQGGGWESSGGGWARSRNEAQNLAYSAHRK